MHFFKYAKNVFKNHLITADEQKESYYLDRHKFIDISAYVCRFLNMRITNIKVLTRMSNLQMPIASNLCINIVLTLVSFFPGAFLSNLIYYIAVKNVRSKCTCRRSFCWFKSHLIHKQLLYCSFVGLKRRAESSALS